MNIWIGSTIIFIGILHTILGVVFLRSVLLVLWQDGLFNTVNRQPEREFCFWFLFGGIAMILIGALVKWIEKQGILWPHFLGWSLLTIAAVVVFIMPASGGWLLFVPAIGAILKNRK